MNESFVGRLNGKQKAIGFIILMPFYFYVAPMLMNILIYLYIKCFPGSYDTVTLTIALNVGRVLMVFIALFITFKDYILISFKKFKENCGSILKWVFTEGIIILYATSILSNLVVMLFQDGSSTSSANQNLFLTMLNSDVLLMFIQAAILAPLVEELLFRGLLYGSLREHNKVLAYVVSSLVFGFMHIYNGLLAGDMSQLLYLISYGSMGFIFSYAYEKKGNIMAPILLHATNNTIAIIINISMAGIAGLM